MAKVTVDNLKINAIHCKDKGEKLLEVLLSSTDWMHACGGKGRCTTCKAKIVSGQENLSELTEPELKYIQLKRLSKNERLTCQALVNGDVILTVPKEYQLPHLTYAD